MPSLDWLTARPIAHRGLHDRANGLIENTASAFAAAIAGNYAIECDVQLSSDDEAMVYHDDKLGRLTVGRGELRAMTAAELQSVPFKETADRIPTLAELCALVSGRVPLVIELKSHFDGDTRLAQRVGSVLQSYSGPVAAMSFDPDMVIALRQEAPGLPRGIVAESRYDHPEWARVSPWQRRQMANLLHCYSTLPHFVAYGVRDLPAVAPLLARWVFGLPLLTWTVRSEADRKRASFWASQMIFEGFRP
jgi:glycerophosphoryl diester phosphodiesterase